LNVGAISTEFVSVLDMLTGADTKATKVGAGPELGSSSVAFFSDGTDGPVGVIVADVAFLASVGAALSLMPSDEATAAIASGAVPGEIWENYHEVANVLSRVFGSVSGRSVMESCHRPGECDAERATTFASEHGVLHLKIDVPGYPGGLVTLYCDDVDAPAAAPHQQQNSGTPGTDGGGGRAPAASGAPKSAGYANAGSGASGTATGATGEGWVPHRADAQPEPQEMAPRSHLGRGGLRPYGATPKWKRK